MLVFASLISLVTAQGAACTAEKVIPKDITTECECSGDTTDETTSGYCSTDQGTFTAMTDTTICVHAAAGSDCPTSKYCIESIATASQAAVDAKTAVLAAEVGDGTKACDASAGALIGTATVCAAAATCTGSALRCLYLDGGAPAGADCTVNQLCQTAGGCTDPADCATGITATGYVCACGDRGENFTALGVCISDSFTPVAADAWAGAVCEHGAVCAAPKWCVEAVSTISTATASLTAAAGDGKYCDSSTGTLIATADLCALGAVCANTACLYSDSGETPIEQKASCTGTQTCSAAGCADIGACTTGGFTPPGYICTCSGRTTHVEQGICDGSDAFAAVTTDNVCAHGATTGCPSTKYCVQTASTISTATTTLTAVAGDGAKACDAKAGALILATTVCTAGSICDATAKQCLWLDGTTETNDACSVTQTCETTGCTDLTACHASADVATPTSSQCLCNSAASEGNGFCDFDAGFTAFTASNLCAHGAACAAAKFCVKSDFDSGGSTTGTAAEGAANKTCDETTGAVIDTSTVCAATATCDATAKQCLWADGATEKNTACTAGQTCETTGCVDAAAAEEEEEDEDEDDDTDSDTSAFALSGLTGFLLTLGNVV